MCGDRQLHGPAPGDRLADYLVNRLAVYGLLFQQQSDELPEAGPVRADECNGGLLCLPQ
jgi:hypothetical protein